MKLGKLRTLRGQIEVTGNLAKKNLIVADGLVNYGLKILSFEVWYKDVPTATLRFSSILSRDVIASGQDMNAGDNNQFAWTFFSTSTTTTASAGVRSIIDPDHIINRDLYLTLDNSSNGLYNYLIECQVVELTDDEAIVTIIKETSQA